jgi:hypothetical protein
LFCFNRLITAATVVGCRPRLAAISLGLTPSSAPKKDLYTACSAVFFELSKHSMLVTTLVTVFFVLVIVLLVMRLSSLYAPPISFGTLFAQMVAQIQVV